MFRGSAPPRQPAEPAPRRARLAPVRREWSAASPAPRVRRANREPYGCRHGRLARYRRHRRRLRRPRRTRRCTGSAAVANRVHRRRGSSAGRDGSATPRQRRRAPSRRPAARGEAAQGADCRPRTARDASPAACYSGLVSSRLMTRSRNRSSSTTMKCSLSSVYSWNRLFVNRPQERAFSAET